MIIYKCDVCGKQIEDINYGGQIQIKQKHIAFLKHNKDQQVRVLGFILCVSCAEIFLGKINFLREEFKKNARID